MSKELKPASPKSGLPEVQQKVDSGESKLKPAIKASATPPEDKTPILKVNFKTLTESLLSKNEIPEDAIFKTTAGKELHLRQVMVDALDSVIEGQTQETPYAISRCSMLNAFCIANKLTPSLSKRTNKEENKAVTMYGQVPAFEDGFAVDGDAYRQLGFLRYPIVRASNGNVAVKYDIYFVILTSGQYVDVKAGKMLEDAKLVIVA
jgi:hypothetical protein